MEKETNSQAQQIKIKEEEEFKKQHTKTIIRLLISQPFTKAPAISSPISLSPFAPAVPKFTVKNVKLRLHSVFMSSNYKMFG